MEDIGMLDVLAIGEMLIDFTPGVRGVGLADVPFFEKKPGGAPANVAVGVAKLGGKAAFLGKFGADPFGDFLIGTLRENGVDTTGCIRTQEAKTGLAFIALQENGEHSFHFYRDPSADMLLSEEDIDETLVRQARIVHVGSVTAVTEAAFQATLKALRLAREAGNITSFDVNFRLGIWRGREEEGKRKCLETIRWTDVLKVSEWEMQFLTGTDDVKRGAEHLLALGPKIVFVTLGEKGVYYATRQHRAKVRPFPVQAVDVTGAGDGFTAGFLRQLADRVPGRGIDVSLSMHEEIEEMARYGCAVGALVVSKVGAIPALPTKEEVFAFMYAHRKGKRVE
jgi:fructokinase